MKNISNIAKILYVENLQATYVQISKLQGKNSDLRSFRQSCVQTFPRENCRPKNCVDFLLKHFIKLLYI